MNTLFPVELNLPEGFLYFPDFLTEEEEKLLCEKVLKVDLHIFNFQGFEAKRKIASFGYDYSFEKKALSKGTDIPPTFDFLIEKVAIHLSINKEAFAELLVIQYPVSSVINWHCDAPPFDIIAGISFTF